MLLKKYEVNLNLFLTTKVKCLGCGSYVHPVYDECPVCGHYMPVTFYDTEK